MDTLSLSWLPGHGWDSALPTHLDSERTLVLAFGPGELREAADAIADLRRAFPESVCVGASSQLPTRQGGQAMLAVSITRFDKTRVGMVLERPHLDISRGEGDIHTRSLSVAEEARICGRRMGDALLVEPGLSAALVFADRKAVNRAALMRGLADVLPEWTAICDGTDNDSARASGMPDGFQPSEAMSLDGRTWVLAGGSPVTGIAVAVGLYSQGGPNSGHAYVATEPALTAF